MMKEDEERKPISPTLRSMEVNDVEAWPLERIDTVTMTVGRFSRKFRAKGIKFRTWTEKLEVKVQRIA